MSELNRIKIFINHLVMNGVVENQKGFGVVMGYNNESSISQILTGKVKMPDNFIKKLKSNFPEINDRWIETGEGGMLIDEKNTLQQNSDIVSMPADVWAVISSQAESLKMKDEQINEVLASLKSKDKQVEEVIELLKEQLKKGRDATTRLRAANLVVEEDE